MATESAKPTSILRPLVEELHERRAQAALGGGEERIARQHAAEKLTARERLDLLMDEGTFTELGIPGLADFVPIGQGPRLDGPGRPAPRPRRGGRGRLPVRSTSTTLPPTR